MNINNMNNLLEIEIEKNEKLIKLLEYKESHIKLLENQIRGGKNIEESLEFLIYKYNLKPGSYYFKREAAYRIMMTAIKQCRKIDTQWKNMEDPEMEELSKLNYGCLDDLYKSKVYLKLLEDYKNKYETK